MYCMESAKKMNTKQKKKKKNDGTTVTIDLLNFIDRYQFFK